LFAIGALFRGLSEAANIKNQTKGMEIFGDATGIAMKGIVSDLRAATGGMLDFRTAAQQAQIATAAGFNAQQIKDLGKGAKLASVALGRDLTDSFNRLLRGVTKAEPELLDELGIILRIDDATRKYAQANDLVASKLTISQRRAAVFEEVSRQLANNFSAFENGADEALNDFEKLSVAFSDILKNLTQFIGPLEAVAQFLSQNTGAAAVLFAGFAASIMKSAFPALTDLTKALAGYQATSQSMLRAEKVKFQKMALLFKKNAADANFAELKKSAAFKKFLKKRGMDETAFFNKSTLNQRRSISLMIANLQKRAAAGKAINEAELALFIKTRNQMVGVQAGTTAKIVSITKAGGAAAGAAITVPALLARMGLAQVGKAALALAPVFTMLGGLISGAFTILTVGFIAKFLYDMLFVSKEEKEERAKIKSILDATAEKLKEIKRIGKNIFEDIANNADAPLDRLNARLLATYNLIAGLGMTETISKYEEGFTGGGRGSPRRAPKLDGVESTELASSILAQITAVQSLGGGAGIPEALANLFNDPNSFGLTQGPLVEELKKRAEGKGEMTDKQLLKTLSARIQDFQDFDGGTGLLKFMKDLNKEAVEIAKPGEGLYNVSQAAKTVKDTLATMSDGYKPTTFDTLNAQMEDLANNLEGAIGGSGEGAYHKEIEEILGMSFKDSTEALKAIRDMSVNIATVVEENARILESQSNLARRTAALGGRKDAFAVLEKRKIKSLEIDEQIASVANKLNSETYYLNLAEKEGEEIAQRKLVGLELQLKVLQAQQREYKRANTIAGQLQDTFRDGLDDMFLSIIDGTTKAKDAFKQLAVVVIQEMQRILAVRMASSIINMMSNFATTREYNSMTDNDTLFNADYGVPDATTRYGGYSKGYAAGGIADGPDSGYNVLMHGREAIVPLPDGDKIPVQLTGKGQGPVNSVINVTVNNEGDVETSSEESSAFGEAIQAAVTREIAEQQRPGGLLSPI
jgi:hypothetical protein